MGVHRAGEWVSEWMSERLREDADAERNCVKIEVLERAAHAQNLTVSHHHSPMSHHHSPMSHHHSPMSHHQAMHAQTPTNHHVYIEVYRGI